MKKFKELTYLDLQIQTTQSKQDFKSTNDIGTYNGIIGQQRALKTVKEAMQISQKGFNLYVCGQVGMGKTPYVLSIVNNLAKDKKVPNDLCYVHNFDNPNEPIAIFQKPGEGREFKESLNRFVNNIREELARALSSDDFEKKQKVLLSEFETKKNDVMKRFDSYANKQGFKVKSAADGIYFSPIYQGKVLNEEEFNSLDKKIRDTFTEKSPKIQEETKKIMKQIEDIDKEYNFRMKEWQQNISSYVVSKNINNLKIKYKGDLKIQNFLYSIQTDIIKNIDKFKEKDENNIMPMLPQMRMQQKPWEKYVVNLFVNNENLDHAPVIVCTNPSYFDLFGKLEYENQMGSLKTDHTMLKPGLFHKANGGYLLVNARDLITNMVLWEAFKRVLRNSELTIDVSRDMQQAATIISVKPEIVDINTQVILFGSERIYQQLSNLDSDFRKLFKMKADFDDMIDKCEDTIQRTIEYIAYVVKRDNLLPFSKDAVEEILNYSSKCAGDRTKLTAMQVDITDIIIESSYKAKNNSKKIVKSQDVLNAIENRKKMYGKYNDNIKKMIEDGSFLLSTSDAIVGCINGLTIINTGDASYGKPIRITANTYMGKSGIVNIEREISMSGTSHSKGVFILSAYIGEKFGQNIPLCFNASICFEQLYNGVDGDSASSTELYAILSSLSGIPIKQGIAVTGSVNQKGEIQPIGGVTEKVEGFFEVCKMQGITKNQGVIIPHQNVKNLVLKQEVIDAVKNGDFHIYPVSKIDEGIEILTGIKLGQYTQEKGFEKGTISYLVHNKLKDYAKLNQEFHKRE